MKIKKVFFLYLIVFLTIFLEAKSLEKVTIKLTWANQFEFAGIYAAKEKGFYKDLGLDVQIIQFSKNYKRDILFQKLNDGEINYSIISSDIFLQKFEGKDIFVLSSYSKQSLFSIVTKKDIKEPIDLKDKKIISSFTLFKTAMWGVLKFAGLNKSDIKLVQRDYSNDIKQFVNDDSIKAMTVFNPDQLYELDRLGFEYNLIDPYNYNMLSSGLNLICSKNEAFSHSKRALKFTRATNKGWNYAFENKDEIVNLISTKYKSRKSKEALLYEANKLEKIFMLDLYKIGEILPELIRLNLDTYKRLGIIDKKWKYKNLFFSASLDYDAIYNQKLALKNKTMHLSFKEKEYIKNNPIVKVSNENDWAPFDFVQNGEAKGYSIDIIRNLAKKIGIKVKFENGYSWNELLNRFENNQIDLMHVFTKTPKREKVYNYSLPYVNWQGAFFVRDDDQKIKSTKDFKDIRIGAIKGWYTTAVLKSKYPKVTFIEYENINKMLIALSLNDVDAIVGMVSTVNYAMMQELITNVKVGGYINISDSGVDDKLYFASHKDAPELISLFNKALNILSIEDKLMLQKKWFGVEIMNTPKIKNISLTNEELAYLQNKKKIKMCVNPNRMPFEKIHNNKYIGLSFDYVQLFSKTLDIPIQLVQTESWNESLLKSKNKECDIFPLALKSKELKNHMDFTSSYITTPIVIATKANVPFIDNIEDIKDRRIGIVKDSLLDKTLRKKYQNINLVDVKSVQDGLDKIEKGEIFAYLDSSAVINYQIQSTYLGIIAISGKLQDSFSFGIATRKDEPVLNKIFNKVIDSISSSKKQEILNRWIRIKYVQQLDYTPFLQVLVIFIVTVLIFILFYIRQNKLKKNILKQKELFEAIFNSSKDAIAILDLDSNFIKVNQAYCDMTGYTNSELLNISAINLSTPRDMDLTKHTMQKAIEAGYIKNFSKNCICKDGKIIDVNITMTLIQNPKRLLINVRDVTELKKTENLLIEKTKEQDSLLSLFDKGEVCLFQWNNDANWSAQYVSKNVSSLFGYTKDEFISKEILYENIIDKDNIKKVQEELIDAIYLEVDFFVHSPYKIKTKDNQIKWVLDNTLIVRDQDNNVQHLLGYIVDITDLKEYETMLEYKVKQAIVEAKQKEKLLREQSRLAQMGEMLSMIAHQWRQPLGAISSAVIATQMNIASGRFNNKNEEFLEFLDKKHKNINEYVHFLSTTIDDFRNFFKPNKNKELVELTLPIQRALNIVSATMKNNGIKIIFDYNDKQNIYIYQNEVMQVILNILKNSEDNFIEKDIKDREIVISTQKYENQVYICISDNGNGIDEDVLPKIFDPYFSTKLEKNGTGLGLYMSKVIIEEHNNGKLNVRNSKEGVCFEIVFNIDNESIQ